MASAKRIELLSSHLQAEALSQQRLSTIIDESTECLLGWTHRTVDIGERWDALVVDIALIRINMQGAEGSNSASEGGVSRSWSAIPEGVKERVYAWRIPMGMAEVIEGAE